MRERGKRRRPRWSVRRRALAAVLGVGGLSIAAVVTTTGLANVLADDQPDIAVQLNTANARALGRMGENLLLLPKPTPQNVADARAFARRALRVDATYPTAWRTLGLGASFAGNDAQAASLFATAEQMSRRDTLTELALIELEVGKRNISGALVHYDHILRVSPETDGLLLPTLISAAADPAIRIPLARMLVRAPAWRRRFFSAMAIGGADPDLYATLVDDIARFGPLPETDILSQVAGNYAQSAQFDAAWRIYNAINPSQKRLIGHVRNGRFSAPNASPPFDWQLESGGSISADQVGRDNATRLEIISVRGDSGRAARQLLRLAPGAYTLSFRTGAMPPTAAPTFYAQVVCAIATLPVLRTMQIDAARSASRVGASFRVPRQCRSQWLEFGLLPSTIDEDKAGWIADVKIDPARVR